MKRHLKRQIKSVSVLKSSSTGQFSTPHSLAQTQSTLFSSRDVESKEISSSDFAGTSMALVLYDENSSEGTFLGRFYKSNVVHKFAGKELHIRQDWKKLGVAGVVWDATLILGKFIEDNREIFTDKEVIEIGAGSGLAGMVAALIGSRVTLTDREEALEYLSEVVSDNFIDRSEYKINTKKLDWRDCSGFNTYDIIIGADVIYIEDTFPYLLETLDKLSDKETIIYLSCRIRYQRDNTFLNMMNDKFNVEEIFFDKATDIKIFKARKK